MHRLILLFAIFMVTISAANAKYIPYKELKNYSFSKESGWRGQYQLDSIIVGTVIIPKFDKNFFTVHISKKLYNELNKYSDYKSKLKKNELTGSYNSKSYNYELILPISLLEDHSTNIIYDYITIYTNKGENKICNGSSAVDNTGYIWCTANKIEDLLK